MNDVQEAFGKRNFVVLAFPCNQFGAQEPGKNWEIKAFAAERKASFDLFTKIRVTGSNAHSIYKYLAHKGGHEPRWNFAKYLVDSNGNFVEFFDTEDELNKVTAAIDAQIKLLPTHGDL